MPSTHIQHLFDSFQISIQELEKKNPKVKALLYLPYPDYRPLIKHPPKKRMRIIDEMFVEQYEQLLPYLGKKKFKVIGGTERPRGVELKLRYSDLKALSSIPHIKSIHIREVKGYKQKVDKSPLTYYAVKIRLAIKVEGQRKGKQTYEDSIWLTKATSPKKARKQVKAEIKANEEPYLNTHGRLVLWQFEKIIAVYETGLPNFSEKPDSTPVEVFSEVKSRTLKTKRILKKSWS